MELTVASAVVILVVIFLFRSSIKRMVSTPNKVVDQVNDVVINNILESRVDITIRTQEAMKKLREIGTVDFEEAYLEAMGRKTDKK